MLTIIRYSVEFCGKGYIGVDNHVTCVTVVVDGGSDNSYMKSACLLLYAHNIMPIIGYLTPDGCYEKLLYKLASCIIFGSCKSMAIASLHS